MGTSLTILDVVRPGVQEQKNPVLKRVGREFGPPAGAGNSGRAWMVKGIKPEHRIGPSSMQASLETRSANIKSRGESSTSVEGLDVSPIDAVQSVPIEPSELHLQRKGFSCRVRTIADAQSLDVALGHEGGGRLPDGRYACDATVAKGVELLDNGSVRLCADPGAAGVSSINVALSPEYDHFRHPEVRYGLVVEVGFQDLEWTWLGALREKYRMSAADGLREAFAEIVRREATQGAAALSVPGGGITLRMNVVAIEADGWRLMAELVVREKLRTGLLSSEYRG
ncbi:hypothetical protein CMUS01_03726 [Colletotrichum musicola]|uniref:Uncharacterized protein n=1 Tax=Colletotrichum musicola TaxID=2175873 RepID=A0A8H6NR30_9PEZI|nr:hypothetical protein CMUS01_03726 [Colletotrichum musicola]